MEEFGGDLSRMIQARGFRYKIQSKFLDQLALENTLSSTICSVVA